MPPQVATLVYIGAILGLFALARDRAISTSKALWIPVIWLFIGGSRNISEWLDAPAVRDPQRYIEGNSLDRTVLTALLVLAIVVLVRRPVQVGAIMRSNVAVFVFFAYCGVSVVWSDYSEVAFKRWIRGIGDLVMVLVVLTETDQLAGVKRFLTRAGWWLMALSVLMIRYYPDKGRVYDRWSGAVSWTGVGTDKNMLGMIAMLFGLASVWHFLRAFHGDESARRPRALVAHAVLMLVTCWLLMKADSATSIACFVLGSVIMLVGSRRAATRHPASVHLVLGLFVLIVVSALFYGSGTSLVATMGRDPTITGRTEIWRLVLEMNDRPLLGAGYDSFWLGDRLEKMSKLYAFQPNQAHNGYIEVLLNLGWVGVALIVAVLLTGYRHVITALRAGTETASLGLAYVLVTVIYNFTEGGFKMMHPVWVAFLLITIVLPKPSRRTVLQPGDGRTGRPHEYGTQPASHTPTTTPVVA